MIFFRRPGWTEREKAEIKNAIFYMIWHLNSHDIPVLFQKAGEEAPCALNNIHGKERKNMASCCEISANWTTEDNKAKLTTLQVGMINVATDGLDNIKPGEPALYNLIDTFGTLLHEYSHATAQINAEFLEYDMKEVETECAKEMRRHLRSFISKKKTRKKILRYISDCTRRVLLGNYVQYLDEIER